MLALPEVRRAVDLQQKAYRLLLWLGTAIDRGQVVLDQAHDTLSLGHAGRAFLNANLTALPAEHRPALEDVQAFANVFASYLTTSFDLLPDPGTRRVSNCGCTCDLCTYLVSAPHLVPKKLAPVDKVRARRLEVRCIEAIARERGVVLGPGAAETLADEDSLREAVALAAYGRELLKRVAGDFEGPEVLALWRRFAWTRQGSPKKGFTLTAQASWRRRRPWCRPSRRCSACRPRGQQRPDPFRASSVQRGPTPGGPMRRAHALVVFSLLAACRSTADAPGTVISTTPPSPRTVAVTGMAEIETTPDEFVVTVGVDTTGPDAARAKSANDAIMRALLDVPRQLGVDPRWVRTEGFSLAPHFEGPWDARRLVGFEAHKTLVLVLHDDNQVEPVLEALFRDGANRIEGVQFKSTKILEQRKQARTKAVAAAREKAEAMAGVLGQKVGRPLRIDETAEPSSSPWSPPSQSNVVFNNETRSELREAMAAGKIRVPATVTITFELGEG